MCRGTQRARPCCCLQPAPAPKKRRGVVGAAGLGAAAMLLLAQNAEAATEVAQLAASDNRVAIIGTLFVPVLGWVGFNMLQPALNQLERMSDKTVSGGLQGAWVGKHASPHAGHGPHAGARPACRGTARMQGHGPHAGARPACRGPHGAERGLGMIRGPRWACTCWPSAVCLCAN
jgi:hypothetical protein